MHLSVENVYAKWSCKFVFMYEREHVRGGRHVHTRPVDMNTLTRVYTCMRGRMHECQLYESAHVRAAV
jgi:hypothetical protein